MRLENFCTIHGMLWVRIPPEQLVGSNPARAACGFESRPSSCPSSLWVRIPPEQLVGSNPARAACGFESRPSSLWVRIPPEQLVFSFSMERKTFRLVGLPRFDLCGPNSFSLYIGQVISKSLKSIPAKSTIF